MTTDMERIDHAAFGGSGVVFYTTAGRELRTSRKVWNALCDGDSAEAMRLAVLEMIDQQEQEAAS